MGHTMQMGPVCFGRESSYGDGGKNFAQTETFDVKDAIVSVRTRLNCRRTRVKPSLSPHGEPTMRAYVSLPRNYGIL